MASITKLRLALITTLILFSIYTLIARFPRFEPSTQPGATRTVHSTFSGAPANTTAIPFTASKNAYIFYATSNTYACSALVNIHRLRNLSGSHTPIIAFLTPSISSSLLTRFRSAGVLTIIEDPPKVNSLLGGGDYYRDSLLKLRALGVRELGKSEGWWKRRRMRKGKITEEEMRWLAQLERVVVLDSDQLVVRPLDDLFSMPIGEEGLAAPEAYWLRDMEEEEEESGSGSRKRPVTSALLVADLTHPTLWRNVSYVLAHPRRGEYDMDIINRITNPQILDPGFCVLNSVFRQGVAPTLDFSQATTGAAAAIAAPTDADAPEAGLQTLWDDHTKILHFTDGGKPWDFVLPENVPAIAPAVSGASVAETEPWGISLRRWILGESEEEVGERIWEEAYRVWQTEAAREEVCGWTQHVLDVVSDEI